MAEDTPARRSARPRPTPSAPQPSGADVGWGVTGTLLSGMAVWGGVGWLLDRWLDTGVFLPVGVLLGMTVAIYLVVVKYGTLPAPSGERDISRASGAGPVRPGTEKGRR